MEPVQLVGDPPLDVRHDDLVARQRAAPVELLVHPGRLHSIVIVGQLRFGTVFAKRAIHGFCGKHAGLDRRMRSFDFRAVQKSRIASDQ